MIASSSLTLKLLNVNTIKSLQTNFEKEKSRMNKCQNIYTNPCFMFPWLHVSDMNNKNP